MSLNTEKKPNILQARIDNRLIHGQVATIWTPNLGANLLLVANDKVANDPAQQSLLELSAGSNVHTRFFTVQETIDKIHKASAKQAIFLIIENSDDALRLVEGKVPIDTIVLGNMHPSGDTKTLTSVVSVSQKDLENFKKIEDLGVKVVICRVPTDSPKSLSDFKV